MQPKELGYWRQNSSFVRTRVGRYYGVLSVFCSGIIVNEVLVYKMLLSKYVGNSPRLNRCPRRVWILLAYKIAYIYLRKVPLSFKLPKSSARCVHYCLLPNDLFKNCKLTAIIQFMNWASLLLFGVGKLFGYYGVRFQFRAERNAGGTRF